jgi:hypothetical protein
LSFPQEKHADLVDKQVQDALTDVYGMKRTLSSVNAQVCVGRACTLLLLLARVLLFPFFTAHFL